MQPLDLAYIGLGIALLAVCAWLSVPFTIPFTMQTFAVCLIAALLGIERSLWVLGCYLLLGAFGVPVFSGFRGGFGVLAGASGGYLIGFVFTALVVGLAADHWGCCKRVLIPAMVLGLVLCYAFGTAWFLLVYSRGSGAVGIGAALMLCVVPYLPADACKLLLACFLAVRLRPLIDRPFRDD